MMRLSLPLACLIALGAAACDGDNVRISSTRTDTTEKGVLKVIQTLQCPQTMGDLTRKGTAQANGTVCTYAGPKGAEVSLHLVTLGDTAVNEVLKAFEDRLIVDLPHAAAQIAAAEAEASRASADAARADAEAARADAEAARADVQAGRADAAAAHAEVTSVRLPGMHIETRGESADIRIGGLSIRADDGPNGGRADIDVASGDDQVSIRAHNNAAEVRTTVAGDATRATWIMTDDQASPNGWRLVGYEARGPVGGPIVVATVRSKDRQRSRAFDDAEALVALNVGE